MFKNNTCHSVIVTALNRYNPSHSSLISLGFPYLILKYPQSSILVVCNYFYLTIEKTQQKIRTDVCSLPPIKENPDTNCIVTINF